jgi:hypothetical protein
MEKDSQGLQQDDAGARPLTGQLGRLPSSFAQAEASPPLWRSILRLARGQSETVAKPSLFMLSSPSLELLTSSRALADDSVSPRPEEPAVRGHGRQAGKELMP